MIGAQLTAHQRAALEILARACDRAAAGEHDSAIALAQGAGSLATYDAPEIAEAASCVKQLLHRLHFTYEAERS